MPQAATPPASKAVAPLKTVEFIPHELESAPCVDSDEDDDDELLNRRENRLACDKAEVVVASFAWREATFVARIACRRVGSRILLEVGKVSVRIRVRR